MIPEPLIPPLDAACRALDHCGEGIVASRLRVSKGLHELEVWLDDEVAVLNRWLGIAIRSHVPAENRRPVADALQACHELQTRMGRVVA